MGRIFPGFRFSGVFIHSINLDPHVSSKHSKSGAEQRGLKEISGLGEEAEPVGQVSCSG